MRMAARALYLPLGLLLTALVITGCSPTPEERYEEAIETLKETTEERNDLQERVDEQREELAEITEDLEDADDELAEVRQQVEQAARAVGEVANDEILFRTIQRELLDQSRFDEAAIAVGVDNRVVTLTGSVPDEDVREAALEVARSQPGVRNVVDSLTIEGEEADNNRPGGNDQNTNARNEGPSGAEPKPRPDSAVEQGSNSGPAQNRSAGEQAADNGPEKQE